LAILDKAGAKKMDHKQIVAYLSEQHQVGPWWQQMVTVGYEQARPALYCLNALFPRIFWKKSLILATISRQKQVCT